MVDALIEPVHLPRIRYAVSSGHRISARAQLHLSAKRSRCIDVERRTRRGLSEDPVSYLERDLESLPIGADRTAGGKLVRQRSRGPHAGLLLRHPCNREPRRHARKLRQVYLLEKRISRWKPDR